MALGRYANIDRVLMRRAVMGVDSFKGFHRHAQVATDFKFVDAPSHKPRCQRVPKCMSQNPKPNVRQRRRHKLAERLFRVGWPSLVLDHVTRSMVMPSPQMGQ